MLVLLTRLGLAVGSPRPPKTGVRSGIGPVHPDVSAETRPRSSSAPFPATVACAGASSCAETKRRRKLAGAQFNATVLLSLVFGVFIFAFQSYGLYRQFPEMIHKEAQEIFELNKRLVARSLYEYDADLAYNIVMGVAHRADIYRAQIVDRNGIKLSSFVNQPSATRFDELVDLLFDRYERQRFPVGASPIDPTPSGTPAGYLVLSINKGYWFDRLISDLGTIVLLALIWSLLVAFGISFMLYLKITRPIMQLTALISRTDLKSPEKNNSSLTQYSHNDEIGDLYSSLVQLSSNLRENIENRVVAEKRLRLLADTDPMTGLYNRRAFSRMVQALIKDGRHFAFVIFDIDHFKAINDDHGHDVGDRVIIGVACTVRNELRERDVVARLGGEEFGVLLPDITPSEAVGVANRLRVAIASTNLMQAEAPDRAVTVSMGVASSHSVAETSLESIFKSADVALYAAKTNGRNRVEAARGGAETDALSASTSAASPGPAPISCQDIDTAIDSGEFFVVYQPKVVIGGNGLPVWTGLEALMRWQRPGQGVVSPAHFLPMLLHGPRAETLVAWLFREIDGHLEAWQGACGRTVPVAVNVATLSLENKEINHFLREHLGAPAPSWRKLEIEITESERYFDLPTVQRLCADLAVLGVTITLDDFGVGFSSMERLIALPADRLKLDRALTAYTAHPGKPAAVIGAILQMAGQMGVDVVAEGVETRQQLSWLQGLGCTHFQGFLFDKPLTATEVADRLANGQALRDGPTLASRIPRGVAAE